MVKDMIKEMVIVGGVIFGKMKVLGIEYVFINFGIDFLLIIEGLIEVN